MPTREHTRIRVVAADHETLFLDGIVAALDADERIEVAGRYTAASDALDACIRLAPHVVVLGLGDDHGSEPPAGVGAVARHTAVVLLSDARGMGAVSAALEAGASAVLSRRATDGTTLIHAIAIAADSGIFLDELAQRSLAMEARFRRASPNVLLTTREVQVLQQLAAGQSASAIADTLVVGTATIRTHLAHVYEKLGVSNRAAAVAEGMRRGLVD